jgi:predicted enzyme related to lactoylglutathione lyase
MTQPPAIGQTVTWVYTRDLGDTCRFYGEVLGLELVRDEGAARIYLASADGCIGVCEAIGGRTVEPKGTMITLVTDDVDSWYARLLAAGATTHGPPHQVPQFGIYAFLAEDPNGYLIEFQRFLDDAGARR